ncbi:hypothetical protein [Halorussus ruber]|uniref:hypothetical protein n=1 Tax=Halorussus ruber TaxID=1126238 RepID=UPI00143CCFFE|nr:hypothetical protein [Halorussus ruber]
MPWHTTYLTVTALGVGLLVGVSRLPTQFGVARLAPAALVVGLFTATSLIHWYDVTDTLRS